MCGIVAIIDLRSRRTIDRETLVRMNESQFHRGPDESGLHLAPGIGLGHRRLSIIDLATGQQPLYNADRSVVVIFNGEIYNYRELIAELSALGYAFRTRSDTEVIVHAWQAWGEKCVDRFRGMFAFVLWDEKQQRAFIARDRLGVKPLFYAELPDGFLIVGSELKSLLAHGALARDIDPFAVEDYFAFGYVPEPRTIFESAAKLPPGHSLTVLRGASLPAPREYWDVAFTNSSALSAFDASSELIERLRESVRLRMISEVPLGAFLSGGVDSSAVVAMMAETSGAPVNTCSISFSDAEYDESKYAQHVAQRYRTQHYVERVESDDFDLIDLLARLYDEPYADSSAIPTYRVCELARKRVTVALSGDGGDESFAGYRRYRLHMMEERMRQPLPLALRRPVFGLLGRVYPKADWAPRVFRGKTTLQALARDSVQAYFHSVSLLRDDMRSRMYSNSFKAQLAGYNAIEVFRRHAAKANQDDPLSLIQYLDIKTYLVGDINTKVDRASMAHSLEVREPLMDHPLVEWLATLPSSFKLRGGEGKWLFKKAMQPYLPNEVLYRPKMGFGVPLASWLRGPLRERVRTAVLGDGLADTGLFDPGTLRQLLEQHQSGRRDHSDPLWSLLMFDAFVRQGGAQQPRPHLSRLSA